MEKKVLIFGDYHIDKNPFHKSKIPISIDNFKSRNSKNSIV